MPEHSYPNPDSLEERIAETQLRLMRLIVAKIPLEEAKEKLGWTDQEVKATRSTLIAILLGKRIVYFDSLERLIQSFKERVLGLWTSSVGKFSN